MKKAISTKQYGLQAALLGFAAIGIYLIMIYVTLAHIEALSGLRPFDMRPGGYSPVEANTLLDALGASGRRFYLTRQIPLDLAYPALMALTLISLLKWLGSRGTDHRLVQIGIWLSIGTAIADYLENAGICIMILSWPNTSDSIIQAANVATIAKASLMTMAILTVLLAVAFWARERMRNRS
jgi:hypothetical protein